MNYVSAIQRAINYVENHLTEKITFDEIAKQAYCSSFSFQRAFSLLCGFSLGDYIRFRRLSVAGEKVAREKMKVIDAALSYGYDSPESFTRAFTAFHGVTPREAKKKRKNTFVLSPYRKTNRKRRQFNGILYQKARRISNRLQTEKF